VTSPNEQRSEEYAERHDIRTTRGDAAPDRVVGMSSGVRDHGHVRVLVVEDHPLLVAHLAEGLRGRGLAVDVAMDGAEALEKASCNEYDVVVLDRDLPRVHGDDVCRALATNEPSPRIIMLTAAGDVTDRVEGLELGADDYLAKPFAFVELVARIEALARRRPSAAPVVQRADLTIDVARHVVTRDGRTVSLNRKEFALLELLALADGAVVSSEEIFEKVWDERTDPFSNIVAVTIARLRRKLGGPPVIETVIGCGYRL
jgi:DNA-binding response OmpR family regulator